MPQRIVGYPLITLLLTLGLSHAAFAQNEKQAAHGILIDNTGSLRSQFPEVLLISKGIVGQTHPRGPVSLFNFRTDGDDRKPLAVVTAGSEWSQDRNFLERYVDSLYVVAGQTALKDAISHVAERVNARASLDTGAPGEKIIFLITDGEDRVSKIKEEQLLKMLKTSGIKVNAVGLTKELDHEGGLLHKSKRGKAVDFLEKLTKETGGRVVFATSRKDAENLLKELFAK